MKRHEELTLFIYEPSITVYSDYKLVSKRFCGVKIFNVARMNWVKSAANNYYFNVYASFTNYTV
jgi:hypothetical protein